MKYVHKCSITDMNGVKRDLPLAKIKNLSMRQKLSVFSWTNININNNNNSCVYI